MRHAFPARAKAAPDESLLCATSTVSDRTGCEVSVERRSVLGCKVPSPKVVVVLGGGDDGGVGSPVPSASPSSESSSSSPSSDIIASVGIGDGMFMVVEGWLVVDPKTMFVGEKKVLLVVVGIGVVALFVGLVVGGRVGRGLVVERRIDGENDGSADSKLGLNVGWKVGLSVLSANTVGVELGHTLRGLQHER